MKNIHLSLIFLLLLSMKHHLVGQAVAKYFPDLLELRTHEIIDSTLSTDAPHLGVFIAHGLSGRPADQFVYWKMNEDAIPLSEYDNIKNHPSPIIRYYAYQHLLAKLEGIGRVEFILKHLNDRELVRCQNGCHAPTRPLIDHVLFSARLNGEQNLIIAKAILKNELKYESLTKFAYSHVNPIDENYQSVKTLALQNDREAILQLLEYKALEDEDILRQQISRILPFQPFKTSKTEELILSYAVKYNFPINTLDSLYAFHKKAKRNGQLKKILSKHRSVYHLLVKNNHPERVDVINDLILITPAPHHDEKQNNPNLNVITTSLKSNTEDDLLETRLLVWEKYHKILYRKDLKTAMTHFPKQLLKLVNEEMILLENNAFDKKKSSYFMEFLTILEANNIPTAKYITLALESENTVLNYYGMKALHTRTIPSSNTLVIFLLDKLIDKPAFYKLSDVLTTLTHVQITTNDQQHIQHYVSTYKDTIDLDAGSRESTVRTSLDQLGIEF